MILDSPRHGWNYGRTPGHSRPGAAPTAAIAVLFLLAVILTSCPNPARAAMATVDSAAIAKLTQQINEMRRQMEELVAIKQEMEDAVSAVGEAGSVVLPAVNIARLSHQLRRDLSCLMPNWEGLLPTLSFEEIDLENICSRRDFYRQSLFTGGDEFGEMSLPDQNDHIRLVRERWARVLADAVAQSLAQADQSLEEGDAVAKVADELGRSAESADTANERLAVIAQAQAGMLRALAKIIQILAQMQRADAAFYLKTGTAAGDEPPEVDGEGGTP